MNVLSIFKTSILPEPDIEGEDFDELGCSRFDEVSPFFSDKQKRRSLD